MTPDWPELDSSSSSEMQRGAAAGNLPDFPQNLRFHIIAKGVQRIMPPRTQISYDSIATVGEIRVYQRADFQSGSRVLKKVF